jgi:hypothetical protein
MGASKAAVSNADLHDPGETGEFRSVANSILMIRAAARTTRTAFMATCNPAKIESIIQ